MMKRALLTSLSALACWGSVRAATPELPRSAPLRATLIELAREAEVAALPADTRLSMSLAWRHGEQAKVCGVARRPDGELLLQDGRLQLKRVILRQDGARWHVARAERVTTGASGSIEEACGETPRAVTLAAALRELEAHPPGAGRSPQPACRSTAPSPNPDTPGRPGHVSQPGRSLLHSAPDLACYMGRFIVNGDKVKLLAQVMDWTLVRYTHPITQVTTVGWLKSARVQPGERPEPATRP